jgi:hypothetical protein
MECSSEDSSDNTQGPNSNKDQRVYFVPKRSFPFQFSTHSHFNFLFYLTFLFQIYNSISILFLFVCLIASVCNN